MTIARTALSASVRSNKSSNSTIIVPVKVLIFSGREKVTTAVPLSIA
jgi:hypothetical protein